MAYEKIEWVNGQAPAIDADNLNRMEDGIDGALQKTGGTMTGELFLVGDPTENMQAVTKQYADNNILYVDLPKRELTEADWSTVYNVATAVIDFSADKYIPMWLNSGGYGWMIVQYDKQEYKSSSVNSSSIKITSSGEIQYKTHDGKPGTFYGEKILFFPVKRLP